MRGGNGSDRDGRDGYCRTHSHDDPLGLKNGERGFGWGLFFEGSGVRFFRFTCTHGRGREETGDDQPRRYPDTRPLSRIHHYRDRPLVSGEPGVYPPDEKDREGDPWKIQKIRKRIFPTTSSLSSNPHRSQRQVVDSGPTLILVPKPTANKKEDQLSPELSPGPLPRGRGRGGVLHGFNVSSYL